MAVYIVQPGDTFSKIAQQHGISISELQQFNPQVTNINQIDVGQQLTVPDVGGEISNNEGNQIENNQIENNQNEVAETAPLTTAQLGNQNEAQVASQYSSTINTILRVQGISGSQYTTRQVNGLLYILVIGSGDFRRGERVPITLYKVNVTNRAITLRYNTGQRFELVIRRAADQVEVWRYSRGRFFTQQSGTVTIRPNQYAIYRYTWDQTNNSGNQVAAGNFILEAFNVAQGLRNQGIRGTFRIRAGVTPTPTPTPGPTRPPGPGACTGQNLLTNSSFESWRTATQPAGWNATNVRRSNIAFSGRYSVEMGNIPTEQSTLAQTFPITPGSNNRVSFRIAEDVEGSRMGNFQFGIQVLFRDRSGRVVGVAPQGPFSPAIIEDERFELFTFTTGRVPGTAVNAELVFTFNPRASNRSRIRLDMAEVRCLNL
ncbi:BsuPI-related putative proteinase inhibitor [Desulfotomaculum sp. 1211_IL3151]|uniref:BsuPI-related putative proteinase inhibitor n=1 Tax=Desulfotomaculum sp. 1211_IL3151 TaxID=3084055 RepID=UPI002FD90DF1